MNNKYYKFLIKLDRSLSDGEINSIKKGVMKVLIDVPIVNIHGGVANNNGYEKFNG